MISKFFRFWKSVSKCTYVGSFENFWIFLKIFIDVSVAQRGFLKFEFWFSGLVGTWNGWNIGSLESPSPKPHFRPWKAIFDHKKSTFDHFEPFSNHQVSSVCHFRLWSSDSQWFKLIQTESKSRIRKPEFPKIKTNKIFHAFSSPYCHQGSTDQNRSVPDRTRTNKILNI